MSLHAHRLPAPSRRRALRMVVLGLVLLISGAVLGGATMAVMRPSEPLATPDGRDAEAITASLRDKLGLSPNQAAKVRDVMQARLEALARLRAETATRVAAEHEVLVRDMGQVLTPDQFKQWKGHFDELRRRHAATGPARAENALRAVEEVFATWDRDHDGKVRKDEVPDAVWERIERCDANGDGAVSADEMKAARERAGQ